jgi:phosphatidylserine/phosphatidylglycerophosphate/cardiolipin synthase-like enzyme
MHLGALKVVAQKVPVRGIISNVDPPLSAEIKNYADESPYMELRLFEQRGVSSPEDSQPHQKLIVIDGLLAFKGSANLTLSGWRKAAIGRDVIEVVTNVNEVRELHNRFFSPILFETNPSERYDYDGTPY